jgi:hypothetical protein
MANSDDVTSSREILKIGDIAYKRANSEAVMSRFAATNNFISKLQTDIKEFKMNGSYSVATGITYFDGIASFFYNSEIVGVTFWNGQSGTSGTTEFDLRWQNATGTDQGSIFSVTPKINSTSSDETFAQRNLETGNDNGKTTGVTLPTFSKTQFLEGEAVYAVLNSSMVSAQNCGITIFYRPIN